MVEKSLAKKGFHGPARAVGMAANGQSSAASKNGTGSRALLAKGAKVKVRAKTRSAVPRGASRRKLARGKAKTSH
jgi:hypothetical protein